MKSILSKIRVSQQSLGRLLAALFVAVWLNLALAPCLMAMPLGAADQAAGCEHCPEPDPSRGEMPGCGDGGGVCLAMDNPTSDGIQMSGPEFQPEPALPVGVATPECPVCRLGHAGPPPVVAPPISLPIYLVNCAFLN